MTLKGKILNLNKQELIDIIKNNPDKSSWDIDKLLIKTIDTYYGRFSIKQSNWILAKIKYIVRGNSKYKEFRGFKDICLL